jgi:glutathionyl-hydroquinone reductase
MHQKVEEMVESAIGNLVFNSPEYNREEADRRLGLLNIFSEVLNELDYVRKITVAKRLKVITDEESNLFMTINQYRVYFSHEKYHRERIEQFKNRQVYLVVLQDLAKAAKATDVIAVRRFRKINIRDDNKSQE